MSHRVPVRLGLARAGRCGRSLCCRGSSRCFCLAACRGRSLQSGGRGGSGPDAAEIAFLIKNSGYETGMKEHRRGGLRPPALCAHLPVPEGGVRRTLKKGLPAVLQEVAGAQLPEPQTIRQENTDGAAKTSKGASHGRK